MYIMTCAPRARCEGGLLQSRRITPVTPVPPAPCSRARGTREDYSSPSSTWSIPGPVGHRGLTRLFHCWSSPRRAQQAHCWPRRASARQVHCWACRTQRRRAGQQRQRREYKLLKPIVLDRAYQIRLVDLPCYMSCHV